MNIKQYKYAILLYFLSAASYCCCSDEDVTNSTGTRNSNSSSNRTSENVISLYKQKICEGRNTCDIVEKVAKKYRDLRTRNCMCDEKCADFGDCCEDSKYMANHRFQSTTEVERKKNKQQQQQQQRLFICKNTTFDGNIYVIASCAESWNDTKILENCNGENSALPYDVLLLSPVTNVENGITYKNVFCALCNYEKNYEFWNVAFTYEYGGEADVTLLSGSSNSSNLNRTAYEVSPGPAPVETIADVKDVLSNLTFNETGEMFWSSTVNDTFYRCYLDFKRPSVNATTAAAAAAAAAADLPIRYCVPKVIDRCADEEKERCESNFVSYTYAKTNGELVFKNERCASCNGFAAATGITGCANRNSSSMPGTLLYNMTEIAITDAVIPKVFHCEEFPPDSKVFNAFCKGGGGGGGGSSQQESQDVAAICFSTRDKTTGKKCKIDAFLQKEQFHYVNNETIYVKAYEAEFPIAEWLALAENHPEGPMYLCGTVIPVTKYQQFMDDLNNVVTQVLIKISVVCIVLHLLVFAQLPELRNLSGKNLASFCVALLTAFVLFDLSPLLPSCKYTAILQHYCFLSCFSWMLTISYDVWLSLYRATAKFRTSGGKRNLKFVAYSIVSWLLPAVIVAVAVYAEFAPVSKVDCPYKPAYGEYDSCFIGHKYAMYYYFVIPASIIFFVNICFFTHTASMIYLSQRKSVNPNTRHDFRLYSRLGLLMGLTWVLGTFLTITDSQIIAILFTVFNMCQGIFIFFGFTFKKKILKSLLQKHRSNRLIYSVLSTFISKSDIVTPDEATRQTQTECL